MYRTVAVCLFSLFAFACTSSAQSVPDLSDKNWKFLSEESVTLGVDAGNGQSAGLATTAKFYANETDKATASVLMWKDKEVAMVFGTEDNPLFAIKVTDKWYAAKDKDTKFSAVAIYAKDGSPTGVRLTLDTKDGLKEVILNLN